MADKEMPKFANEAEEARWYAQHPEFFREQWDLAKKEGRLRRLSEVKLPLSSNKELMARGTRASPTSTIRLPQADIARARHLAERKGLRYQTYIKMLLREALDRAETGAG